MDFKLELVILPVRDVDRLLAFYANQDGLSLDRVEATQPARRPAPNGNRIQHHPTLGYQASAEHSQSTLGHVGQATDDIYPGSRRPLHPGVRRTREAQVTGVILNVDGGVMAGCN
jgi:hypothetical protein